MDKFYPLVESPLTQNIDTIEKFVEVNPYIIGQAIIAGLVGVIKHGGSYDQYFEDLANPELGNKIIDRMKSSEQNGVTYSNAANEILSPPSKFTVAWFEKIKQLYGLSHDATKDEVISATVDDTQEANLADLNSVEVIEKVINPLIQEFS